MNPNQPNQPNQNRNNMNTSYQSSKYGSNDSYSQDPRYRQGQQNYQGNQGYQGQYSQFPPRQGNQNMPYRSTTQHSTSYNQPVKNIIEHRYKLLPKITDFKEIELPKMKGFYLTNYFQYRQNHSQKDNIYLYSVETIPTIPPDSHDLWYRLIRSVTKKLQKLIGVITFRANTIWGRFQKNSPITMTTSLRGQRRGDVNQPQVSQQGNQTYQMLIKMTKIIKLEDLYKSDDSAARPLFVQMVNNTIKERMHELGYFQLGKGRFYANNEFKDTSVIKSEGLNIMKGFKFTFISLGPKRSYLQIDTCSRILRVENFYETLVSTKGTRNQKLQMYKGATLLARYGNHKTYTLQDIDESRSPLDTFPIKQNNQQIHISFAAYLEKCYGIKITQKNQPMLRAIAKVEKKIEKGKKFTKTPQAVYLIPEFMILTGMSNNQRGNHNTMREVADYTKTNPLQRKVLIDQLSTKINNSQINIQSMAKMEGYKLTLPTIRAKMDHQVKMDGSFELTDRIKDDKTFELGTWGLAYTNRISDKQAQIYYNLLRDSAIGYGIKIEQPFLFRIQAGNSNWSESIDAKRRFYEEKNKAKLKFILFILTNQEITCYNIAKKFCTKNLKIKTQFVKASTFDQKGKPAAAKIALQMAAKEGKTLWTVPMKHQYWKNKRIAMASISYSKTFNNSFTIALVGTTKSDQSSVYTYSMVGLARKDQVGAQIYRNFYMQWLKSFANNEKALPDSIIIYREGLSDVQIKKTISEELQSLYFTINTIKTNDKRFESYNPEIVIFIVNKKVNSKFYDFDRRKPGQFYNPSSGSIIFFEMSSNNQIEFYLVPQKVREDIGTATPTQYKMVYYKSPTQSEESSFFKTETQSSKDTTGDKIDLPLCALAQLTYEQCFNYYNWHGAIKIPSVLKCGDKLSTLIGQHVRESVNCIDFQNTCNQTFYKLTEQQKKMRTQSFMRESNSILNSYFFL